MKVQDIMTAGPCCCSPDDSVQDAARLMRDNDCGSLPVVDQAGCTVGIVTDRDLAVRALADGQGVNARVADVMTSGPSCCGVDDDVRDVERLMADRQVRRVPIVDADGCCVGIVAQADLARAAQSGDRVSEHEVAIVVERISEPSRRAFDRGGASGAELRL
jgi:CBS domain-containing protein